MNKMKAFSSKLKENAASVILCLCELIVGILLLFRPVGFTRGIIIAFGLLLVIGGGVCIYRYFKSEAEAASRQQNLTKGLIIVMVGLFCVLKSQWFIAVFPILTILYGVVILFTGAYKVQYAVDSRRLKKKNFLTACISAVLALLFAAIILWNPFKNSGVRWGLIAVYLIVEAILDCVVLFGDEKKIAAFVKNKKEASKARREEKAAQKAEAAKSAESEAAQMAAESAEPVSEDSSSAPAAAEPAVSAVADPETK
ncbi:MAG: DUF308 domain-containing protein [Lachnospiraceae bacterium]|nr:DUF308 domain-containing protein [Lachnospiraceae bacterium]